MSTSGFAFVPRKLTKTGKNAGVTVKPQKSTQKAELPNEPVASSSSLTHEQKKNTKYLEDSAYTTLFELALSEHALWSNHELLEAIESSEEGFIPISYLTQISPAFAGLSDIPPETVLVRCARASGVLECRFIVSEPSSSSWFTKSRRSDRDEGGGFEIRRKDWADMKDRIRSYSSFHWDSRTVYVENLPHQTRTFHSVHEFILQLLASNRPSKSDALPIQSITFPLHQKDDHEAPPPTIGKGFAFVVLSSIEDVDYLLERWPWELGVGSSRAEEEERPKIVQEATERGFRCLSKRKWDELKGQYLSLQRQLLEKTLKANAAGPSAFKVSQQRDDESRKPREENGRTSFQERSDEIPRVYEPPAWYPKDCLVFVKNVHPETNKTTLRTLFSSAFDKNVSAIDYVDYNKGLDSCYLRLSDPSNARTLVSYFSDRRIIQQNGLDSEGIPLTSDLTSFIEVELVQGKKAELYWEKVPEKIRKAALVKIKQIEPNVKQEQPDQGKSAGDDSGRKRKRRKGN